jgi:predicted RNase H-like HicB family nuclease
MTRRKTRIMKTEDLLRAPYKRVLIPDEESGTYTAEIAEFPGCVSQGQTPQEALENLETAARGWIEAVLDLGQEVPPLSITEEHSGKISLRLPRSLHRRAAQMAQRDGVSLNLFIATAIAEKVGAGHPSPREERQPAYYIIGTPNFSFKKPGFSAKFREKAGTGGVLSEDLQLQAVYGNVC